MRSCRAEKSCKIGVLVTCGWLQAYHNWSCKVCIPECEVADGTETFLSECIGIYISHFMLWLAASASVPDPGHYNRNTKPSLLGARSLMAGGAIKASLESFLPVLAHHFEPVTSASLYSTGASDRRI